jgi:hypothetical protein
MLAKLSAARGRRAGGALEVGDALGGAGVRRGGSSDPPLRFDGLRGCDPIAAQDPVAGLPVGNQPVTAVAVMLQVAENGDGRYVSRAQAWDEIERGDSRAAS